MSTLPRESSAPPSAKAAPSVEVIVVNYRTPKLVVDCIRSLDAASGGPLACTAIVLDANSGDGSAEAIAAAAREEGRGRWLSAVALDSNRGYAAGNNEGLHVALQRPAPPDYVLLLNPDTVVRPGAIEALVDFMERHPEVGIAGSRLENPDGSPQQSAFHFPGLLGEFEGSMRLGIITRLLARWAGVPPVREEPHEADWVAGASMIVRREVFDAVGVMDDAYFLYFEEVDFCLQAKRAGWTCWYVPASRVVHLVGQSTGLNSADSRPKRRPKYWFESRRRYFVKNHGPFYAAAADLIWALGFMTWRVRRVLQRKPDTDPPHLLADFLRHSVLLHPSASRQMRPSNDSRADGPAGRTEPSRSPGRKHAEATP